MTRTSRASLALVAVATLLGAAPARAQEPEAKPEPLVLRGTATNVMPSLPPVTSSLDVIRRRGVLRVGVAPFVPWVINSKSGSPIGFEIDVATRLADDLGVKVEFVPASLPNILDDLLADRFDLIASAMSITPARALVANFSIPYSEAQAGLVANRAKAAGLRTLAGFDRPEVTIGVRAGGAGEGVARQAFPKAKIQPLDDEDTALDAVLTGKVTAIVGWSPAPEFLSTKAADKLFLPLADPLAKSRQAFAVRKGDADFLAFLDTWIRYQQDTGWLAEKRKYWFNSFAWEDQL